MIFLPTFFLTQKEPNNLWKKYLKALFKGDFSTLKQINDDFVKLKNNSAEDLPKTYIHEKIFENEIFTLEEIKNINEEEFVPGIKNLSIQALSNYNKFI